MEIKFKFCFLAILSVILSSCASPQSTLQEESETKEISKGATFSKSINDPADDCIGSQTGDVIECNKAVDIISVGIEQKNKIITVDIELAGNLPSVSELKEVESSVGIILPELYQYTIDIKIDGNWRTVLFGDMRADTKKSEGACGSIYIFKSNILGACKDSQVKFLINENKVQIVGPLNIPIDNFRITTLYEEPFLGKEGIFVDKDDIIDEVESS